MLKRVSPSQGVLIAFASLLVIEFVANVLLDNTNQGRTLSTDNWNKLIANTPSSEPLAPLNALFGLRSESELEQERIKIAEEKAKAEQLKQQQAKAKADEVIVVGKDSVRLFGISLNGNDKVAIISVKNLSKDDKLTNLKQGESLSLHDGMASLTVEKVLSDSIQVSVINNKEEKSSFNLVIFNYGI